nr:hypothetical protein Itr_chr07CG11370 [Ipomoea trifida]
MPTARREREMQTARRERSPVGSTVGSKNTNRYCQALVPTFQQPQPSRVKARVTDRASVAPPSPSRSNEGADLDQRISPTGVARNESSTSPAP